MHLAIIILLISLLSLLGFISLFFPKATRSLYSSYYKFFGMIIDKNHFLNSLFIIRISGVLTLILSSYFISIVALHSDKINPRSHIINCKKHGKFLLRIPRDSGMKRELYIKYFGQCPQCEREKQL